MKFKKIVSFGLRSYLFWLLLVNFLFRFIYYSHNHTIQYNVDTATYYYAAQYILDGVLDAFRTPIYPIVIRLFQFINEADPLRNILIFQHIVSFASIIPFYLVCKQWFNKKYIAFFASLVYTCLPQVLSYNNAFFPESLLLSSLVFFLYLFCTYIIRPSIFNSIAVNLYVFYLVMLKPGCIFLYGILAIIWTLQWIFKNHNVFVKHVFIGFLASVFLLLGYCQINKNQNDVFAISTVSHDNNFANVILSNAYVNFSDDKLISIIDTLKKTGHFYTVYYLNNDSDKYRKRFAAFPSVYPLTSDMQEISHIPENKYGYTAKNLYKYLAEAMYSKEHLFYLSNIFVGFSFTTVLFLKGYMLYILLFIETVVIIHLFVIERKLNWMRFLVLTVAIGILVTVLIGGVNDGTRDRVLLPIAPFLVFILFDLVDMLVHRKAFFKRFTN